MFVICTPHFVPSGSFMTRAAAVIPWIEQASWHRNSKKQTDKPDRKQYRPIPRMYKSRSGYGSYSDAFATRKSAFCPGCGHPGVALRAEHWIIDEFLAVSLNWTSVASCALIKIGSQRMTVATCSCPTVRLKTVSKIQRQNAEWPAALDSCRITSTAGRVNSNGVYKCRPTS